MLDSIQRWGLNLPQQLVGLVDHLGGGQVVVGKVGVLAGSALDAAELLLCAGSEHHETHSSCQVSLGHHGTLQWSASAAHWEETEAEDESFQHEEDEEICKVQCQNFRGGGGPRQHLHCICYNWHGLFGIGSRKDSGQNSSGIKKFPHIVCKQ